MYWSTNEMFHTSIFSKVMARDRFLLILKFIHFNDNEDPNYDTDSEDRDRLHKIRPLIDLLRERCQKVYQPGCDLSVDESLVLFKGRLHFKQFIRTKRARFGVKLYELTTSDGITLDFLVYCGKGMFADDDPHYDMPSTERIPVILLQNFLGKGHVLYTDNFYTSPSLALFLLQNKTHLCGTIRTNRRKFSKEIVNVNLEKGTSAFYVTLNQKAMLACKYRSHKDKAGNQPKVVHMLSTCHQPSSIDTNRTQMNGDAIIKPEAVWNYNLHMGGVDRVDQQLHSFDILRKSYKWYKKIAFRLISQCLLNSSKVYDFHAGAEAQLTFHQFVHSVISSLIIEETAEPELLDPVNENVPRVNENISRLNGRHFMSQLPKPSIKKCRVCYAQKKRTANGHAIKTSFICKTCPSKPGLHPDTCFELFHTKQNFTE